MNREQLIDELCEKFKSYYTAMYPYDEHGSENRFAEKQLRKLLSEAVVVYGNGLPESGVLNSYTAEGPDPECDTHCALLIGITPINQAVPVAEVIECLRKHGSPTSYEVNKLATRLEKYGVRS